MLRLITGRAGSGKTALIMDELKTAVERGAAGGVLIVPEQYSHEAERELCAVAGPRLSLYGRVLSFTGVARLVDEELGSGGVLPLDDGGSLLCMALALDAVYSRLRLYSGARRSPELQKQLLAALSELRAARLTPEALDEAAERAHGALALKLRDLSLIMAAYDAAVGPERRDKAGRLDLLLAKLPRSTFGKTGHIYIDGFTDFTRQESDIIDLLMTGGADLTVCLTCDGLYEGSEIFELSRRTAVSLLRRASELGVESAVTHMEPRESGAAAFLAARLFTGGTEPYPGDRSAVRLLRADSASAECELAAARAIELCRAGARWRDIAVAVRSFEDYRPALESAFSRYGVPLYTARKSDVSARPLPSLISSAYEIITGGWETEDVMAYLRTGLAGLSDEESDILENYCVTWSCGASMWLSPRDWRSHPDGYGGKYDDGANARLAEINELRRRVSAPLIRFAERVKAASTAAGQAAALAALLKDLGVSKRLAERSDALEAAGRLQTAAEYARLWEITVDALEQADAVLGDAEMSGDVFSRLFLLTLCQYDVGTIPVALDMVTAGDMDRMRRRHIRHLIVLGASDERLPRVTEGVGVFSASDRRGLTELGLPLDAGDAELWREFTLIYNCLSLPSDTLTLVTPSRDSDGAPARPSFVMSRAKKLFATEIQAVDSRLIKTAAPGPALELAASAELCSDPLSASVAAYFESRDPSRLRALRDSADLSRGSLSYRAARALYGERLYISASRADSFASCRFGYFIRYGLKAKPRESAAFSPPEFGTFMHYVLQNVAADAKTAGGFRKLSDERLEALADRYVEKYIHDELNDFADRSPRFVYLFRRLGTNVRRVVLDMAEELRRSDFQPLDFELNFSALTSGSALPLPGGGELALTGIADRVDGWVHDGRLYLRVLDYKTGRKSFSLSDIWYGLSLQMLMYLFTLERCGETLYGAAPTPAGVMYIPAWDKLITASSDMSDEDIARERAKSHLRSGLLLDDPDVLLAMENSESPVRIPVKWKEGVPTGDALASAERLGLLGRHIEETLTLLAGELRRGSITADPYYKSAQDNACLHCDYFDVCRFSDGERGDRRRYLAKLPATRVWEAMEAKYPAEGGRKDG